MATDVTKDDFKRLETRVDIVEREVEGEKMVTRHILEQTRRNGDDLATLKTEVGHIRQKVDGLERKFDGLTRDLPKIVGNVMREVNRERDQGR